MTICKSCGHDEPHTGGGIGVCLHTGCGCDGSADGYITLPRHSVRSRLYNDNDHELSELQAEVGRHHRDFERIREVLDRTDIIGTEKVRLIRNIVG